MLWKQALNKKQLLLGSSRTTGNPGPKPSTLLGEQVAEQRETLNPEFCQNMYDRGRNDWNRVLGILFYN